MLEPRTNSSNKFRKTKEQWVEKAITRFKTRHYKEALRACNNAIQLDPGYARAYYSKGLILTRLENYDEALASYEKARQLGLHFDMGELVCKMGELLYKAKNYGKAGIFFERAIEIDRKYKTWYQTRTEVLLKEVDTCCSRGNMDDAWAKLKEASLFNPHDYRVLSTIAYLEKERHIPVHQKQLALQNQRKARADFDALGEEMAKATTRAKLVELGRKRAVLAPHTGVSYNYENHCWNCTAHISSAIHAQCPDCKFYICGSCGSCLCGYSNPFDVNSFD